jgi:hypothetical protein
LGSNHSALPGKISGKHQAGAELDPQNQLATSRLRNPVDARRRPRFKINVDIAINSRTSGILKGRTVDLSESGVSAMLTLEIIVGEVVELEFTLPFGPVRTYAIVRQKNAFRYGFQFIDSNAAGEVLRSTCRQLEVEQSLLGEL